MIGILVGSTVYAAFPSGRVPDGLGVNIHFTGESKQDLDMIQRAGFRFVRMDLIWPEVEKTKGVYDFSQYDRLVDGLAKRGIRALFILHVSNKIYESDGSIRTATGRDAFAKFAVAAAERYKNKGVIWELWNEPNIKVFWKPEPNVDEYMALAKAVLPAVRRADPKATCIAPATSAIDMKFLEGCFKQGLLRLVDGVSVHPYRHENPETVAGDYKRLRTLIALYRRDKPDLPIISGEWGYSTVGQDVSEDRQGQYIARQYLINLSLGIPLSIWYDWHDDGRSSFNPEHHFGTITVEYEPKSAYLAVQLLTHALNGKHFVKRLPSESSDYLLVFSNGRRFTLAAWTSGTPHSVQLPDSKRITLTETPRYLPIFTHR